MHAEDKVSLHCTNLQTFNLIFFRSNLQMGKSKEGLGVGEEGDLREREKEKPDVAGDEQQKMNR